MKPQMGPGVKSADEVGFLRIISYPIRRFEWELMKYALDGFDNLFFSTAQGADAFLTAKIACC